MTISRIDLHMHTTVSDGTNSPSEILSCVKDAGIDLFSVTDHDAIKAGKMIPELLAEGDPSFITGVEFSCKDELGKYHILGYGYDPDAPAINAVVDKGHNSRLEKTRKRVELVQQEFGFVFPDEEVDRLFENDNPGKPHIANLMVNLGYCDSKETAINDYIDKVKFKPFYLSPEEVIVSIIESGGIPVLAHPVYGGGSELIIGEELDERVRRLVGFGIRGLEAYYSGFPEKMKDSVIRLAEKYGLYVTAGSDYHGSNKLVQLGDTNLERVEDAAPSLRAFLETVSDRII